ncbi:Hpt domain-containing protein [Piscinibacter koreensis]|uniref:Hpt domain-containing protein n=1 Tax=Piscinibacter koreensis TaxID=2742824 RepID=A0A7Y6NP94_9BURK|nr:Hpt domain-containing protein [Schlegelella koreensis]
MLDVAALARLRELDPGDRNRLVERVLRAFVGSAERLLAQLRAPGAAQDPKVVRHVAHTLKSSSASIGAMRLSQVCAAVELLIRNDVTEGLGSQIETLEAEVRAVLQALQPMLDPTS